MIQFTLPNTTGASPDPMCNYTDRWSSQPNQASCTPHFSYPLISCRSFSSSYPISLFLVYNCIIIAEHKVRSSISVSPCHDHELTPSTAYTKYNMLRPSHTPTITYTEYILTLSRCIHRVHAYTEYICTPSTCIHQVHAYTEYMRTPNTCVHRVQHTPSPVSTLVGFSSLHSPEYVLTPKWSFSIHCAFLPDRLRSASPPWELNGKVTLSHSHVCDLTHLQTCLIMSLECISEFTRSSFSGASGIALKHLLQPVQLYCV
jgi:hypothetical protein